MLILVQSIFVKQYTASRSTVIILLNIDTLTVTSGYFRIVNNSSEEKSDRSAAENELDTDASNSSEENDDAEDVCICIEDVCICSENPLDDEIRDILARLDSVSKELDDKLDAINQELSDNEDKECLEMQAMVLADYTEEELEESDSDDMEQIVNNEQRDDVQDVLGGLGPQITFHQKIQEWLVKMV